MINNELIQALEAAAEKATQGEWWSDVVETGGTHGNGDDCMEGFHSYAVYDQNNHSLLDMTNSTAACITVEDDGDYIMAWDEVARRNAEFISKAHPEFILSLLAEREADKVLIAEQAKRIAELEGALNLASASYAGERARADALQARMLNVNLPTAYDLTGETDGNCSLNDASMKPDANGCYFRRRDVEQS